MIYLQGRCCAFRYIEPCLPSPADKPPHEPLAGGASAARCLSIRQRPEERRPDRRAPIVRDIAAGEAISGMKELGFPYSSRAPGRKSVGTTSNLTRRNSFSFRRRNLPQGKRIKGTFRSPSSRVRTFFSYRAFAPRDAHCRDLRTIRGNCGRALCFGVIALRHSDRAAMEFAEGSDAPVSKDSELGTGPSVDGRGARPEVHAGTAAPHGSAEESPLQGSGETSAAAVAPASDVAPKARMVRIRRTVESPAIARVPLGRTQAPAAASPGDAPESTQASNGAPAGNDVPAAAPRKLASARAPGRPLPIHRRRRRCKRRFALPALGATTSRAILSGMTSGQMIRSTRAAVPASADVRGATPEKADTRTGATEGLPIRRRRRTR